MSTNEEAMAHSAFEAKRSALVSALKGAEGQSIRLGKVTSNLFRERVDRPSVKLNARAFGNVLDVDPDAMVVDTEAMTTYEDLLAATFAKGFMPAVVPELKSITIGGAISGLGIESSSFKYGLAHETVMEMEVMLANGDVVVCTPDNDYSDLFFGLPNAFGTLGYVLRVKAKVIPAAKFVHLTHTRFTDQDAFFAGLSAGCDDDADFLEGVVFGPNEMYMTIGRFASEAPYTSDYTYLNIYYRSIRERSEDFLSTPDFIWRWDTDWFWCSRRLLVQNPLIRRLVGRRRLNSVTYKKIIDITNRWSVMTKINKLRGRHTELIIQDVDVPIGNAPKFLEFFHREIGISPIWVCPARRYDAACRYSLVDMEPDVLYINFGFWDALSSKSTRPPGHFNRLIERQVVELGGFKSLYSDVFYELETFDQLYNGPDYRQLKAKYDPENRFNGLYEKCVLRH